MIYFDTSYLVRLYFADPGWEAVRRLAASDSLACGLLGRAETSSALHRKRREGSLSTAAYQVVLAEFARDCEAGAFRWLPLSTAVVERVERTYAELAAGVFLRAADALHLACAAESGFTEVDSNDTHLLTAAPNFRLRGVNVIQTPGILV